MTSTALDVFHCRLDGTSLIEASAGTGKTWNICALYMRLLLEKQLTVREILVVTFTNAATAELRDRIRQRVHEGLVCLRDAPSATPDEFTNALLTAVRARRPGSDADLALRLEAALQGFDEASIFTIHGFCGRALRDIPFGSGMPLALDFLHDDSDLRLDIVNDFWRRHVADPITSVDFARFLIEAGDTPKKYDQLLRRRLDKPLARLRWPNLTDGEDNPDLATTDRVFREAQRLWTAESEDIVRYVRSTILRNKKRERYKEANLKKAIDGWTCYLAGSHALARLNAEDMLDLLTEDALTAHVGGSLSSAPAFLRVASSLVAERNRWRSQFVARRARLLRELVEAGPGVMRKRKLEAHVTGFGDMLYNVYERLTGGGYPGLASALREHFPAALIDEFQDTDPLQYSIFQSIYSGTDAPLFLVGDPKQAIYRFRNADIRVYLQARREAGALYTLTENQRCSRPLLDALNHIFLANPKAFIQDGLAYESLAFGRKPRQEFSDTSGTGAPMRVWQFPNLDDGPPPKPVAQAWAAAACAAEIQRLLESAAVGGVTIAGRPLEAGDMAVLVRSHADGDRMRVALSRIGIRSVERSDTNVFGTSEADELLRILAAVAEPTRSPLLLGALATEIFGLDALKLEELRRDDAALLTWTSQFSSLHDIWLSDGIGVMLRRALLERGVCTNLLRGPRGERRLTNVLHLVERLQSLPAHDATPESALRWLRRQIKDREEDEESQLRLESDRHLVQILTIHRSKGLEFPIVFLPFLWDGHDRSDSDGIGNIAKEYNEGSDTILDFRALEKSELENIKEGQRAERRSERVRLMYVALTRAVHRCYLIYGHYVQPNNQRESANSVLNWLIAGARTAATDVTPEQLPTPESIDAAWSALADSSNGTISVSAPPAQSQRRIMLTEAGDGLLEPLPPPASIPSAWWIGSYSALAHGVHHEAAAVDHDIRVSQTGSTGAEDASAAPIPPNDILRFPRGSAAGDCIHAVFERADFTRPGGWTDAIQAALRSRPPGGTSDDSTYSGMLTSMLEDVLSTPIGFGGTLGDIAPDRKLVELEFSMPANGLRAASLNAYLREQRLEMPALGFGTLNGFLRGFIDLVFEHDGRFHIVDWKSNHLGESAAAYGAGPVDRAMAANGYHLQHLLYSVALHRHLKTTLPGYSFDRHFGNVYYLFVRGVRPGWRNADGTPSGVFSMRPQEAVIGHLSQLLSGERAS